MPRYLVSLLLACSAAASAAVTSFDQALAEAGKRNAPVLIDFHAPWCYSCYYMKKNVLNGREWQRVEREAVVLEVDADSPEGAALKDRFQVKALPSYVVLNPQGDELGRISAERTRAQFYPELTAITGRNTALMVLRGRAERGGKPGLEASREVLDAYLARHDHASGLQWFAALPEPVRLEQQADPRVQRLLARLELQQAVAGKQPEACLATGARALAGQLDCDSAYDLDQVLQCTDGQPVESRRAMLAPLRAPHDQLLEQRVLGRKASCADVRTAVFVAADYYQALGDSKAEAKVMQRAINSLESKVFSDPRADRNASDNLRVFYEANGDDDKLDALLLKLIAVWPEDYVYANRYARLLAKRGQHQKALPYFAQAAEKAYGVNRLKNAEAWTQSLLALHRQDEARQVVAATLKANGPWFPDDAARLKKLVTAS
ncbi:MAG: thioredoxin family protein [Stagnimonas sp.]|nr:thioredoxin family protein [Stagnimonas sp.]